MTTGRPFNLDFSYGLGKPAIQGRFKVLPEDFEVEEIPGYVIRGMGEHALLQIRKRGCNTEWVARNLAKFAGVRARDVGYAGRKDRHAVTTQWFSCWLPGRSDPSWQRANIDGVEILSAVRHDKKLRPGALKANRFDILLRDLELRPRVNQSRPGLPSDKQRWMDQRLTLIAEKGVPNYFGSQRFGVGAENLCMAEQMFQAKHWRACRNRGLYISAARSWLFNQTLSRRIADGHWGDRKPDGGSRISSLFGLGDFDKGEDDYMRALQPEWCEALIRLKMKRSYRAVTMDPEALQWDYPRHDQLRLTFTLPRGCYATALLRELLIAPEFLENSGEE